MISLIACVDRNMGLGYKNELLIKLPADMKHFRKLTMGKPVVFGRKTYESIGKPLDGRSNIVLTKNKNYTFHPEVTVYNSVADLITDYKKNENDTELMICGGERIYREFIPFANKIYLTIIHHEFEKVDSHFNSFHSEEFKIRNIEYNQPDEKHPYTYVFVEYDRKLNIHEQ